MDAVFIVLAIVLPKSPESVSGKKTEIPQAVEETTSPVVEPAPIVVNQKVSTQEPLPVKAPVTQPSSTPPQPKTTTASTSTYTYYSVTDVVDGDTIKVSMNGTVTTLRLIGMDTPETVDPRKPVQCFGKEASNKAKELLSGKKVRLETDASQGTLDKYGRTLAYVYRDDGLFYNKLMIEQGYAHEYTYSTSYKYQSEFKAAQKSAQTNLLGLWSPSTCNGDTTSSSTTITTTTQTSGSYYTSSYSTSKYYYPASCEAWKTTIGSSPYLKSFNTLEALLKAYPSRIKSPQCE